MSNAERNLVIWLRILAIVSMLAIVPVFMPHAWMNACHRALGLGPLPETPIIVYLTRSLSALYAFHSGLAWIMARDIRRFAPLITYLGVAFVVFGLVILGIDAYARLPWFWTATEGPMLFATGTIILVLQRRVGENHVA